MLIDPSSLTLFGFPGGSGGKKKSACNAGDLGSSSGLGRSPEEGNGNPLQYSWQPTLVFFATPWTTARQAPLSMGFPRQKFWNGLLVPSPVYSVLYSAVKLCTEIE